MWWFTCTPPQSHWYGASRSHSRDSSRALPTASDVAYSHSASSSFGSLADRPGSLPRAWISS